MSLLLTGGAVFLNGSFQNMDLAIDQGRIVSVSPSQENTSVIELDNCLIVPGFVDVHVHLREPGFSYKETIFSGTAAAAAGGYTAVCAMPNLKPVPDNADTLGLQLDLLRKNAKVRVYPYGAITQGEKGEALADLAEMAPDVAGFSDDGRGVQSRELMRQAMLLAKRLDKPIVAHCEDESLLTKGWAIHDGDFARRNGFPGNDPASEWKQVERDIQLVRETGCRYHVCHISTRRSVELIREAKARGLKVSCETAPHYLALCEDDLREDGRFKMNPPLRSADDRQALIEGLCDGTIDAIATDHAPHSAEEKSKGLRGSAMGIVGLETAFPVVYTTLVKTGKLSLARAIDALTDSPRRVFGLKGSLKKGEKADLCIIDLNARGIIRGENFQSMGKATPFEGMECCGQVRYTLKDGKIVWKNI